MEAQNQWALIPKANHIIYTPEPVADFDNWLHPYLGYPICPIIGRYNKGEYKIGQTLLDLDFKCQFDNNQLKYRCGTHYLNIPDFLVDKLRNIPQVIPFNRPKNLKKADQAHQIKHIAEPKISFHWIISFGAMGKDFLNYLNHTYLFDQSIFNQGKLLNTTFNLPIIVYHPDGSGLQKKQVQRGICMNQFRSQYMSIHLKVGAPAFSPNNMRVGIEGMKQVKTPNPPGNKNKQKNKNKKKKQKDNQEKNQKQGNEKFMQNQQVLNMDCDLFDEDDLFDEKPKAKNEANIEPEKIKKQHQKYIHFYTSVLLPNDHRVNYHWHIEDEHRQEVIRGLIGKCTSLKQFIENYRNFVGDDSMITQILRLSLI